MADHVRRQIRDAIATALTGLSTINTVYVARVHPIDADRLPALVIHTSKEACDWTAKAGRQERTITVEIEGHAQQASGLVDTFDAIALEVETAMVAARGTGGALEGLIQTLDLTATDIEQTGEPIQPAGLVRLTYRITCQTQEAAPDVPL